MELRVFTEPQQGASYDDLLAVAKRTEALGFDAFFRSDHYLKMGSVPGHPGPTDSWVTLAALARETERIRLGTMLNAGTFRLPGPLAIIVAQVDHMSGGRIELGIGAGWYEAEHTAYGIPFPDVGGRFERLAEQFEIITGLWTTPAGETYSFDGKHYQLKDSPALPKPLQAPHPPLIVGGHGPRRTPALAARWAAELNVPFATPELTRPAFERADEACSRIGRDPATLVRSVAQVVCCGSDEAEVARRAQALGREPAELREHGLAGTPAEVLEKLAAFAALGVTRVYLQMFDLSDLDHLDLLAEEVMAQMSV